MTTQQSQLTSTILDGALHFVDPDELEGFIDAGPDHGRSNENIVILKSVFVLDL